MEEQCEEEVFPSAICIMDRFLSLVQIQKSQLQLLATTCLLLSSKLVQNKIISTDRLVMFTDYSVTCEEIRVGFNAKEIQKGNFFLLNLDELNQISSLRRAGNIWY